MNPILKRGIINIVEDGVFDNITSIHQLEKTIVDYGNSFKDILVKKGISSNTKTMKEIIKSQYNHNTGTAFEIFIACLFTIRGSTYDMIYCKDYVPSDTIEQDNGIDAFATSIDPENVKSNNTLMAIQSKFSSVGHCYNNSDLKNFGQAAFNKGISYDNMIFANYGTGISRRTQDMYSRDGKTMRVISKKDIIKLLANPGTFFDDMRELLKISYDHAIGVRNIGEITNSVLKLRSFQEEVISDAKKIIDSTDEHVKTYVMPTGSGKTLTAMNIMDYSISKTVTATFIVVCVPTILLSSQYSRDVSSHFNGDIEIMRVCSDKDRDEFSIKEDITLNPVDIMARLLSSSISKKNTVIITTYASFDKVFKAFDELKMKVDLCIMDESHHIVAGANSHYDDSNWKTRMKMERKEGSELYHKMFNFTATPYFDKTILDDTGNIVKAENFPESLFASASMNNPLFFGNIMSVPLIDVLNQGFVTPVKLWALKVGNDFDMITSSLVKSVIDKHCDLMDQMNVKNDSVMIRPSPEEIMSHLYAMKYIADINKDGMYVKLICSTPSTAYAHVANSVVRELIPMLDEAGYDFFKENIYVDSMSSDARHMAHWSVKKNRDDIIEEIKNDSHSLVYHYDMMSEGVNIPCITGVIIARAMNETKAIQVIGRAIRPTLKDIELNNIAHDEGEADRYSPYNMENRTRDLEKPFALCIVPVFGTDQEVKNQLSHFIGKLYEGNSEYAFSGVIYTTAGSVEDDEDKTISSEEILEYLSDNVEHLPSFTIEEKLFSTVKNEEVVDNSFSYSSVADTILKDAAPELLTSSSGSKTLVYLAVSNYNLTDTDQMFTIVEKIMENDKICASITKKNGEHKFVISYR